MSAGFFDEVLFNDGEGLDFNDLNAIQRRLRAQVLDGMWSALFRTNTSDTFGTGLAAFVPNAAQAMPIPGVGTRQVKCTEGVIIQVQPVGLVDGAVPLTSAYRVDDGEIDVTLAANASGNPRIDLISVKLTPSTPAGSEDRDFEDAVTRDKTTTSLSKRNRTTLTVTVTQGTPAGSPTKPAVPVGAVPWCYVLVPNGFATTFTATTHFMDVRIPAVLSAPLQLAGDVADGNRNGTWTIGGSGRGAINSSNNGDFLNFVPRIGTHQRVMGVQIYDGAPFGAGLSGGFDLIALKMDQANIGAASVAMTSCNFTVGTGLTLFSLKDPLWGDGFTSPYQGLSGFFDSVHGLELKVIAGAASQQMLGVRWLIAG